ncbi:hypothetical protein ACNAW0_30820, partial [Micromonospora sp. SL1-18]|uniref:hypothetical protein n=1 Tax=Micromonospora sp. SL1-18 TaxID=3399128 RepID=UPI003A4DDE7F
TGIGQWLLVSDEQSVTCVEVFASEKVAVAIVPTAGLQICCEPVQPWPQRLISGLRQHRYARPYYGVEVCLGSTPEGRSEPVGAVVGHWHRLDPGFAEQRGE